MYGFETTRWCQCCEACHFARAIGGQGYGRKQREKKKKKEKKEGMMRFAEYTYADGPARLAADRVGNKKTTAVWSSHRKKNE